MVSNIPFRVYLSFSISIKGMCKVDSNQILFDFKNFSFVHGHLIKIILLFSLDRINGRIISLYSSNTLKVTK